MDLIGRRSLLGGMALLGAGSLLPVPAYAAGGLIPRKLLFGDAAISAPHFAGEGGTHLVWRATHNGAPNIFYGAIADLGAAKPVTQLAGRGVTGMFVVNEAGTHLVYANDEDGDENWRFFSVDLATGKTIPLTPGGKVRANLFRTSRFFPNEIVFGHNQRDRRYFDLFRVDVTTGATTTLYENNEYLGFSVDRQFRLRYATKFGEGNKIELLRRLESGVFEPHMTFEADAPAGVRDFSVDGSLVYWSDSRESDTAQLVEVDSRSGARRVLAEDPRTDIGGVVADPVDGSIKAVSVNYTMPEWRAIDPAFAQRLARLQSLSSGRLAAWSVLNDGSKWLLTFVSDMAPASFVLYDAKADRGTELFVSQPKLKDYTLRKLQPHVIKSRDGMDLVSYLTVPKGGGNLPLVVNVHGGPAARDSWGFVADHQWLADRGYAVLSVNYRGSTGFGRKFQNAGNREWGAKMHDDIIDAVDWAIAQNIADPKRIGIMGGSFGGYEVLVAMTRSADRFACGVDLFGLSNLVGMVGSVPPQFRAPLVRMIGDPSSGDGLADLTKRSPVFAADKVSKPLLIAQGVNDPRVKQTESDQFVGQLRARNVPVIYAVFADEGHGFRRSGNRLAFMAITEQFLAKHLGGQHEPVGDEFKSANFKIVAGADQLPGLPS